MSNSSSSESFISIGFSSALTLIFITLKLCNVIDWSWWWITSPTWISVSLTIILAVILVYFEIKSEAKKEAAMEEYRKTHPVKKSKFMERLDVAMKASEEARKQRQN